MRLGSLKSWPCRSIFARQAHFARALLFVGVGNGGKRVEVVFDRKILKAPLGVRKDGVDAEEIVRKIMNKSSNRSACIRSNGKLRGIGEVVTEPYPGFPTDAQPVLMAAVLRAQGRTVIRETIFENRFRQVPELRRLGADISCIGQTAEIRGVERLRGNALTATDLRGGAAMIVAGLAAEGETVICDDGHVTRGYENFDARLRALGAEICLEY